MIASMHQYIGGQRRAAATGETFDVLDPSTDEVLETLTLAGPAEVHAAVASSRAAFAAAELPEPEEGAAPPGAYTCC